jgi:hypothetical protein
MSISEKKRFRTRSSTIPNRFWIGIDGNQIVAVIHGKVVRGNITLPDQAGYLGMELYKSDLAIRYGWSFEQDGEF